MPDLPLTVGETLAPSKAPARQARLVSTGLAPTADVPVSSRASRESPPCYAPCGGCGALVLTGRTQAGRQLALDVGIKTYVVDWHHGAPAPVLVESRGYPVHRCGHEAPPAPRLQGEPYG
jgi:hypothetical protein